MDIILTEDQIRAANAAHDNNGYRPACRSAPTIGAKISSYKGGDGCPIIGHVGRGWSY